MAANETPASLLRKLREQQGRSLRTVATDVGIAASQLSRLERGERGYSQEIGEKLASYYSVSPELVALYEGKVPADIVRILQEHPEELDRLRRQFAIEGTGEAIGDD